MERDPSQEATAGLPVQATPPGWYLDPQDPRTQRYWDGTQWTEHRSPAAQQAGPPTNGKATASLVLGIVFACGIGSILALVFGYQAKNEIEASNGTQGGEGMATAGVILGWIGVGLVIAYLLFWVVIFGGGLFLSGS
jgi:hypothetical protein